MSDPILFYHIDKPYGEFPVVALERVGLANLFVRAWHSLRLLFK